MLDLHCIHWSPQIQPQWYVSNSGGTPSSGRFNIINGKYLCRRDCFSGATLVPLESFAYGFYKVSIGIIGAMLMK